MGATQKIEFSVHQRKINGGVQNFILVAWAPDFKQLFFHPKILARTKSL